MVVPLVPALITACFALFGILVGKWIDSRHKQTELLRAKLEDFFRSLDSVMQSAWFPRYPDTIETISDDERRAQIYRIAWHDQQQRLTSAVMESRMIGEMYFPSLKRRTVDLLLRTKGHIDWMSEIGEDGTPLDMASGNQSFNELNSVVASIKEYVLSEQAFLTKKFPHWFEGH